MLLDGDEAEIVGGKGRFWSERACGLAALRKRWTARTSDGLGRHLTMLPCRRLRPAQFVPLSSRQPVILRSGASRKVRNPPATALLAHAIFVRDSACRFSMSQPPTQHCGLDTATSRGGNLAMLTLLHTVLHTSSNRRPLRALMSSQPTSCR